MPIECKTHNRKNKYLTLWIALCGNLTHEDFHTYTEFFNSYLIQEIEFCVYFDLRYVTWAPLDLIYLMGKYMTDSEYLAKQRINSSVILFKPHPLLETLLKMLFTIKRPSKPNLITYDLAEGWKFLDKHWEEVHEKVD